MVTGIRKLACQKQQWQGGSQFEPTENYSNEHCGKSKNFFRWWRYQQSNQLQVSGGSHHQWQLYQWRYQEKNNLQQTSNGKFDKNLEKLEVETNTKVKLLLTTAFPAVTYGCKGKKIREDWWHHMHSKEECISH